VYIHALNKLVLFDWITPFVIATRHQVHNEFAFIINTLFSVDNIFGDQRIKLFSVCKASDWADMDGFSNIKLQRWHSPFMKLKKFHDHHNCAHSSNTNDIVNFFPQDLNAVFVVQDARNIHAILLHSILARENVQTIINDVPTIVISITWELVLIVKFIEISLLQLIFNLYGDNHHELHIRSFQSACSCILEIAIDGQYTAIESNQASKIHKVLVIKIRQTVIQLYVRVFVLENQTAIFPVDNIVIVFGVPQAHIPTLYVASIIQLVFILTILLIDVQL
jgi:hypothetical protein